MRLLKGRMALLGELRGRIKRELKVSGTLFLKLNFTTIFGYSSFTSL